MSHAPNGGSVDGNGGNGHARTLTSLLSHNLTLSESQSDSALGRAYSMPGATVVKSLLGPVISQPLRDTHGVGMPPQATHATSEPTTSTPGGLNPQDLKLYDPLAVLSPPQPKSHTLAMHAHSDGEARQMAHVEGTNRLFDLVPPILPQAAPDLLGVEVGKGQAISSINSYSSSALSSGTFTAISVSPIPTPNDALASRGNGLHIVGAPIAVNASGPPTTTPAGGNGTPAASNSPPDPALVQTQQSLTALAVTSPTPSAFENDLDSESSRVSVRFTETDLVIDGNGQPSARSRRTHNDTPSMVRLHAEEDTLSPADGSPIPQPPNFVSDLPSTRSTADSTDEVALANVLSPSFPVQEDGSAAAGDLSMHSNDSPLPPVVSALMAAQKVAGTTPGVTLAMPAQSHTGRLIFICGDASGAGKCHGRGTRVLMHDGTAKPIERIVTDFAAGEPQALMGDDSTPRWVILSHVGHTGDDAAAFHARQDPHQSNKRAPAMYRVTPDDSRFTSWTCNGEHELVLRCSDKSVADWLTAHPAAASSLTLLPAKHSLTAEWTASVNQFLQYPLVIQRRCFMFTAFSLHFPDAAPSAAKFLDRLVPFTIAPIAHAYYYGLEVDGNHRFLLADDYLVTHNSSVAMGLLHLFLKRGYEPADLAYIKPCTQCEDVQIVSKYCEKMGIAHQGLGPVIFYEGFTAEVIDGKAESVDKRRARIHKAVNKIAEGKKWVLVDGVGYASVGSVAGVSNAEVASLLHAPVLVVGRPGIGNAIDAMNFMLAYFEKYHVHTLGACWNKIPLKHTYHSYESCKHYVKKYFNETRNGIISTYGHLPLVPSEEAAPVASAAAPDPAEPVSCRLRPSRTDLAFTEKETRFMEEFLAIMEREFDIELFLTDLFKYYQAHRVQLVSVV